MAFIQKAIPGLAKFLGIQTQGLLRLQAIESCQPVLEIEDYLGPNKWIYTTATVALNGFIEITVPDKKFWRMRFLAARIVPGAAAVIVEPYLRKNEVPSVNLGLNPWAGRAGAVDYQNQANKPYGFGYRLRDLNGEPGDSFGLEYTAQSAAANCTLHLWLQYQELDL